MWWLLGNNDGIDDGRWDSRGRIIALGIVVPLLLLIWVIVEACLGGASAYIPRGRRYSASGDRGFQFYEFADELPAALLWVTLKLGLATYLVIYYLVGNHPRWGWHRDKLLLGAGCLVALIAIACGIASL